jgi:glycosyltransferase involved in cell wall biosynthesis
MGDERVKVLFASCAPALLEAAVAKAQSIRPDLPLEVVSEFAPPAERWIRYEADRKFLENVQHCRDRLKGKRVEVAIVVLQPRVPYQRLRLISLLTGPRCILAMNENLDYFDVHPHSAGAIARHIFWRAGNWIRSSRSDENVKVLFASCAPALLEAAVAETSFIRPDLPLEVVSEFAPPAGRWIRYEVSWRFLENVHYCRGRLKGKRVEVAIVMLQPKVPYRRLRLISLLTRPRCILAMNENLDYFDVHPHSAGEIVRHIFWRAGNWIRSSARAGHPLAAQRRQTVAVSDSEIFALCNGSVSVFPGARAKSCQPVVLIASPYLPFPLAHGGAVRMYNLMRRAAANWKQVLISFVDERGPVPEELRNICAEVVTVHRTGCHRRYSTPHPDVVDEFHSPSFRGALRQTVRKWQPDIAQLEFTQLAQYAPDCTGAYTILAEHDITFDLYRQLVDGFDDGDLRRQLDRWIRFERNAWKQVDRVVTMSRKDHRMVNTGNAVVIPNGVDLEYFRPCPNPPDPGRLLFLGSFRHVPNLAGLDLFLKQVWPKVQPLGARLHVIAGPDYKMWLAHYRQRVRLDLVQPAVEVDGFVADVRHAYERAEIVVVPLPISAGTNIKVLEALSMGKAIVTTTQGINGLELAPGDGVLVADTPAEFAAAIAGLIQNETLRRQLAVRARQVAEERFGWESIAASQNALYEELLRQKST